MALLAASIVASEALLVWLIISRGPAG